MESLVIKLIVDGSAPLKDCPDDAKKLKLVILAMGRVPLGKKMSTVEETAATARSRRDD